MNKLITYFIDKQKTLLLIDSVGAILTAFFLFSVLRPFNEHFGMPKIVLIDLSIIAFCFFIYSITCFLFLKGDLKLFIRLIGISNLLYCALTIGLLYKYHTFLTNLGMIYFLIEVLIICTLSYIELRVVQWGKKVTIKCYGMKILKKEILKKEINSTCNNISKSWSYIR